MSLNNTLTNIVKEEGISNIIIEMKESIELSEKITEHKNRNKYILNQIKNYNYEYNFAFDDEGLIEDIFYSQLNQVFNKYSDEIKDNIMNIYGLEIERIVQENEYISICVNNLDIIYEEENIRTEGVEYTEDGWPLSCEGFPYNDISCECYCNYCN